MTQIYHIPVMSVHICEHKLEKLKFSGGYFGFWITGTLLYCHPHPHHSHVTGLDLIRLNCDQNTSTHLYNFCVYTSAIQHPCGACEYNSE